MVHSIESSNEDAIQFMRPITASIFSSGQFQCSGFIYSKSQFLLSCAHPLLSNDLVKTDLVVNFHFSEADSISFPAQVVTFSATMDIAV